MMLEPRDVWCLLPRLHIHDPDQCCKVCSRWPLLGQAMALHQLGGLSCPLDIAWDYHPQCNKADPKWRDGCGRCNWHQLAKSGCDVCLQQVDLQASLEESFAAPWWFQQTFAVDLETSWATIEEKADSVFSKFLVFLHWLLPDLHGWKYSSGWHE